RPLPTPCSGHTENGPQGAAVGMSRSYARERGKLAKNLAPVARDDPWRAGTTGESPEAPLYCLTNRFIWHRLFL
ncbi:MAG TPA: hypothetical protein PKE45_24455, partial [Caldilineaceae bacterium]|nr:hypothetical protein [Caldilineaceae bacterium]